MPTLLAKSVGASNSSGFVASQRNTLPTWDVILSKVCFTHLECCTSSPFSSSSKSAVWLKPGFHQAQRTPSCDILFVCRIWRAMVNSQRKLSCLCTNCVRIRKMCVTCNRRCSAVWRPGFHQAQRRTQCDILLVCRVWRAQRWILNVHQVYVQTDSQNVCEVLWVMLGCMKAKVSSGSTYASMRNSTCVQDMTRAMVHFQCNLSSPCTNCVRLQNVCDLL